MTGRQVSPPEGLGDPVVRQRIDHSIKMIPKSGHSIKRPSGGVPESGRVIKRKEPPAHMKIEKTRPPRPPGAKKVPTPPVPSPETSEPSTTVKKPVKAAAPTLLEDTMGEEELFKKLAQWDKDLKQKPKLKGVDIKTPSSPGTAIDTLPTPPGAETLKPAKPVKGQKAATQITPTEMKKIEKREEELRKYESKLLEREKKLRKKEELTQMLTNIEDTELEGFIAPGEPGIALSGDEIKLKEERLQELDKEIKKREKELQKAAATGEVELTDELYQPIKTLIFSNFIVGPSNRFAHDVALAVAKAPADAYNPLFLYSEVGLGKTHLLCAIGNFLKSKDPDIRIVYASSEKFTNELLDYLRLGEMDRFRTKYRNVDVLLIDDIQFIGGQEGTQEEFFHTFNALYNDHKQIVITSDRPPKNIAHLKDRLRSRFEGGLIVNIKPPDLGTRTRILSEKAEKDGIYIPEEILNYIAGKVKSNVRTLIGILNRVVAHSSLTDRDLDTSLVDEVLHDVLDEKMELTM
jgi:chromosomal replication initiator protein DnaA